MKRIKNTLFLGISILVFSVSSCTEILDKEPQDAFSDINFWKTTDQLKLFANNFYPDLVANGTDKDGQSDNILTANAWLDNETVVPQSGGGWSNGDWQIIRRANYFLNRYQTVVGESSEINQYVAEIKFFRAYDYFNKVKRFGDVPWIDKDLNVNDETYLYKPRTPRKEVIDNILADLQFGAENLKPASQLELGRLHKFAALQMIVRVALYEGTYMKYRNISGWETYLNLAVVTSKKIMDEGGYDIVKPTAQYYIRNGNLVDAKTNTIANKDYPLYYREQFIQEDLSSNKEAVLAKIFVSPTLMHGISRSAGVNVNKDFIEDFLCIDGLPIQLSPLYKGDDSVTVEIQNRDPRYRNTIDNRYLPYFLTGTSIVTNYFTLPDGSGYVNMKFRSPIPAQNEANQSTYDLYIFRYAEVLLAYAEAKAELGTITQDDLDITINKLRARLDDPGQNLTMGRLKLNPPADPAATTIDGKPRYGYAVSPLLYEIRRERRIELSYEGFRWDDIVRWKAGALIENPKIMYGIVASTEVRDMYTKYYATNVFAGKIYTTFKDWDGTKTVLAPIVKPARKWNDKLYLRPIPRDQINLSKGALVQNPGWE